MAIYRGVVRHVRYWRGQAHRWSTVYHFTGNSASFATADAQTLLGLDDKLCYGNSIAANGGTYQCQIYAQAVGGVPIASYTAFNWQTPGSWVAYSGAGWGSATGAQDAAAETALGVSWQGGLSKSGKPVFLRKWYHAVPVTAVSGNANQIAAASVTSLSTAATNVANAFGSKGLSLCSASGRLAGTTPIVATYYQNHQMPRGRRRKSTTPAKQAADYSAVLQLIESQGYSEANGS